MLALDTGIFASTADLQALMLRTMNEAINKLLDRPDFAAAWRRSHSILLRRTAPSAAPRGQTAPYGRPQPCCQRPPQRRFRPCAGDHADMAAGRDMHRAVA